MAESIELMIDGRAVEVEPGTTILEAARRAGFDIPVLSYSSRTTPNGLCRMCVVEVEKMRGLIASCTLPASEGMVVQTDTAKLIDERKFILEMLPTDHPNECMTCEATGACELQDLVYAYQVEWKSPKGKRHSYPIDGDPNPFVFTDFNKCILCTRCVRACTEIQGRNV